MSSVSVGNLAETALALDVKARARALGFDLVGIARCRASDRADYLWHWLEDGQAGEMKYLASRFEERVDPRVYLPGAISAVCVAMNYYVPLDAPAKPMCSNDQPPPPPLVPGEEARAEFPDRSSVPGRIARYALGDDYHELMKARLHKLADWLRQAVPGAQTRACVNTAPVMEKDLAARSGLGWMGKNTCVIHPQIGSWLLLGEVLTTIPLASDEPMDDCCGTCTRCIEACPTQAITGPYQLDARRCISYLTIEHRGEIPEEFHTAIGDWLYGCDICQDVCPFNRRAPATADPPVQPRFATGSLDVREVLQWTDDVYRERLRASAMKRVKLPILKRNAAIVERNFAQRKGGAPSQEAPPRAKAISS